MPCTINKKGPYFVTVHGGSPGTLTFSEKNYLPADTLYKGRCKILLTISNLVRYIVSDLCHPFHHQLLHLVT